MYGKVMNGSIRVSAATDCTYMKHILRQFILLLFEEHSTLMPAVAPRPQHRNAPQIQKHTMKTDPINASVLQ